MYMSNGKDINLTQNGLQNTFFMPKLSKK